VRSREVENRTGRNFERLAHKGKFFSNPLSEIVFHSQRSFHFIDFGRFHFMPFHFFIIARIDQTLFHREMKISKIHFVDYLWHSMAIVSYVINRYFHIVRLYLTLQDEIMLCLLSLQCNTLTISITFDNFYKNSYLCYKYRYFHIFRLYLTFQDEVMLHFYHHPNVIIKSKLMIN